MTPKHFKLYVAKLRRKDGYVPSKLVIQGRAGYVITITKSAVLSSGDTRYDSAVHERQPSCLLTDVEVPPDLPCVYFIEAENGRVKIGATTQLRLRLTQLKIASAVSLRLVGVLIDDDPREREIELHERFQDQRVWGEWFNPSDELTSVIENVRNTYRANGRRIEVTVKEVK